MIFIRFFLNTLNCFFCDASLHPPQDADANLEEEVKRDGDEDESHQVGWGDDRCRQHDDDKRMLAVFGKHLGVDDTQFAEEKRNDRQLEYQSHDQCQGDESGDVGIERDVAHHSFGYAVGSQKSEGDGEKHEITHQHTDNEQDVDDDSHLYGIFPLIFIQSRRNKAK